MNTKDQISTIYLLFARELSDFFKKADPTKEPFEGFYNMKDFFFKRNTLAQNRPLLYKIIDSLIEYKERGSIIIPLPFSQIKSCDTIPTYKEFMKEHKKDLDSMNYFKPKTIINAFSSIGLKGILILSGLRHTTGSMFYYYRYDECNITVK